MNCFTITIALIKSCFLIVQDQGWYIAEPVTNCETTCQNVGLTCTVEGMMAYNGDVDTSEKVISLIGSLGKSVTATSCSLFYTTATDSPLLSKKGDFCHLSSPNKTAGDFSCLARPGNHAEKQRLCYCHKGNNQTKYS